MLLRFVWVFRRSRHDYYYNYCHYNFSVVIVIVVVARRRRRRRLLRIGAGPHPQGRMLPHNISQGVIISNHSLVLQGVSRATAGNYSCVGYNAEGDGISPPFTLNVLCKYYNKMRVHA